MIQQVLLQHDDNCLELWLPVNHVGDELRMMMLGWETRGEDQSTGRRDWW